VEDLQAKLTADAPGMGSTPRTAQRVLALTAAIWHNWSIGAPIKRSLIAYDHERSKELLR